MQFPRSLTMLLLIALSTGALSLGAQTTVVRSPDGNPPQVIVDTGGGVNSFVVVQTATGSTSATPQGVIGGVTAGSSGPLSPRDQPPPATGTSRIRGRIIAGDTGRPLRRAIVRLAGMGVREGRSANTDVDGQYEFVDLPAGQYTLSASKNGYVQLGYKQSRPFMPPRPITLGNRDTLERIDIALPPGGVITGRVVDEFGEPVSEVMVSAQRMQFMNGARRPVGSGPPSTSNDIGEFRLYGLAPGEYYVSASPRSFGGNPFEINTDRTGYGTTYYPSAPDPSSAQRVAVRSGDLVANIVVALAPTRVARVSGTALDDQGRPARGGAVMASTRETFGPPAGTAPLRPDGTFVFNALAPGDYTLRTLPNGPTAPNQMPAISMAHIIVNGTDISNVILQPQAPVPVSGQLTGDPAVLAQIKPANTRVIATPVGPMFGPPGPPGPPPAVHDDLTFEIAAYPSTFALRVTGITGAVVKAVRAAGRDVTRGLDLEAGAAIPDVEIELAAVTAKIAVTATNARSEPVPEHDVLIFPQDESLWGAQLPGRAAYGVTDEQGRYQSPALLAGAYYVIDPGPLGPGESSDPDVLADLRNRAQRIVVNDGETANVQVRVQDR